MNNNRAPQMLLIFIILIYFAVFPVTGIKAEQQKEYSLDFSINDDFALDTVIITVETNIVRSDKVHTVDDFSDIGCFQIDLLNSGTETRIKEHIEKINMSTYQRKNYP